MRIHMNIHIVYGDVRQSRSSAVMLFKVRRSWAKAIRWWSPSEIARNLQSQIDCGLLEVNKWTIQCMLLFTHICGVFGYAGITRRTSAVNIWPKIHCSFAKSTNFVVYLYLCFVFYIILKINMKNHLYWSSCLPVRVLFVIWSIFTSRPQIDLNQSGK